MLTSAGVVLLSQLTPEYRLPLNVQTIVGLTVYSLVLGIIATWLQKHGWW
jgi:hypothetical protein